MSNYTTTNRIFRPVKCKEADLKNQVAVDGYVYFAMDSKKIFCANNGEYLPMGGNSGVYYGNRTFSEDETNTGETDFIFNADLDIEGDQIPNIDDLILNIPDGGFYRVIDVYGTSLTGRRLAVSGVGGGEGGGGSTSSKPIINDSEGGTRYFVLSDTDNMKINFSCSSALNDGNNYIASVKYYYGREDNPEESVYKHFGDTITFDISKHIDKFSTTSRNTLQVEVTDAYGNKSLKKNFYFYLIELTLSSDATLISKIDKNSITEYRYSCTPRGGTGLENLYIDLTLSPLDNPNQILYSEQKSITNVNTNYSFPIKIGEISGIQHGVYLLTAKFCGLVPITGKVIPSNTHSVQIAVYDNEVGTPLIATNFTSGNIMQYSPFTMQYMIVDEANVVEVKPLIYYGLNYSEEIATLNALNNWSHTFITPGVYDISIQYEGARTEIGALTVIPYEGEVPVIDTEATEFYITSMGKSNSQADKDVWGSKGHFGVFENFLWGNENGWVTNEKGETALKITNGAKLEFPTYRPFGVSAIENGLTIELDFMFSGILDYSKPLIQCLSKYMGINEDTKEPEEKIKTGFHITGQKATLNSDVYKATVTAIGGEEDETGNISETDMALQAFTQYFNEDTRIHLTYVIERVPEWSQVGNNFYFVYTYLNGVLSGIMRLDVDATNKQSDDFKEQAGAPANLIFDSTYGDIYLYNVRVYRQALDMRTIINNYIADLTDIEQKVALYKDNNIFTNDGYISIKAIQDISYSLGVPYVLFNGGNPMEKKFKDAFAFEESYALPVTKSDFRLMSMKMYDVNEKTGETYLAIDVPIKAQNEGNAEEIVEKFEDLQVGTSYLPKRGVQVYGQGTSSMVYPVKNLRLKFVQENDYPQVYEGAYPTEIVCFKADFMDSSSAHNTCTGNLVYDLYQSLNMKTPPQQFKIDNAGKDGVAEYDLVTAIKGFPIICFWAPGDSTDYQFIGRYNFNLDKATPEPFGFPPQWFYTGEKVTDELGRERKVVKACGLKTEEVNGKLVLPLDEEGKEIERDIVQCWEILNNDNGSPTKFLKPQEFATFDSALKSVTAKGDKYNWMEYYEDRYPDAIVSGGKFLLGDEEEDEYKNYEEDLDNGIFRLAKWLNSTATSEASGQTFDEPVFYQTMDTYWNRDKTYYNADGSIKEIITEDGVSIVDSSLVKEESELNNLAINKNVFINKVGQGNYGTYAFVYATDELGETGWYLEGNAVSLIDYGISHTGIPKVDNGLTVSYFETNDWSNSLYDIFETDSATYRLSKFKTEFSQYLNLDFTLFYYVLTLTLLMMDSRAKNMMLATWDQKIWYPIFYDMDTMLGVNNTGFNKFSFDTEDDPLDKVFNGFDSVLWNNVRTCFPNRIADFYAKMRGSMNYSKLMEIYNVKGADAWNEALCSADAYYKYERPYEEGYYDGKDGQQIAPGTISYLYAAQGKRSNHRAWWIDNRLSYLDSKFIPLTYGNEKPSQVNTFSFRAYALPEQKNTVKAQECVAKVPANHKFQLKALNNSYQSLFIGNIVYGPTYTLAGQTVELGPSEVKHEVESYILNPELIADLGDLSDKYIGSLNFPGVETRLTELKFGRSSRSHPYTYEYYYNNLLSALNLGDACPYLQNINIARCTGLRSVNFAKCSRLQVLDAEGTKITNINFPANSILKEIYVPDTLTALILTNQPYLTKIKFDNSASNLMDIVLNDVPGLNTYPLVKEVYSTNVIKDFYLSNINWVIEDSQKAVQGNKLIGIDILDILANPNRANPYYANYNVAQSISGKITVNIPGLTVNEYDIYKKYKETFPNVEIIFGDKITTTKAYNIIFKTDETEDALIHYEVKAGAGANETLGFLTSAEGPTGEGIKIPAKASTQAFDFKFTGYWIDQNGNKYYTDKAEVQTGQALNSVIPSGDMTFYPEYITSDRYYQVKFYNYDNTVLKQPYTYTDEDGATITEMREVWSVKYGTVYDGPIKNFLERDSSQLNEEQRYGFQGWSGTNYGNANIINPVLIDPTTMVVTGPITLYPYFKIENVYEVPTNPNYFQVKNGGVCIKEEYRHTIAGKITIPDMPGAYFIGASLTSGDGCLALAENVTHIFFLKDSAQYTDLGYQAFYNMEKLQKIVLPSSITKIGKRAFRACYQLREINLDNITSIDEDAFYGLSEMKIQINELPKNLTYIGSGAFYFGGPGVKITKIPDAITSIYSYTFTRCPNVKITEFGSNDGTGSQLTSIGQQAFFNSGSGIEGAPITSITFNKSIKSIDTNAFKEYASNTLENVYFMNPEEVYTDQGQTFSNMGFSSKATPHFNYEEKV